MLSRVLKAEQMKLHNSPIWMAFILIPFISAIMGTSNYLGNKEILTKEWYSLWTQHTLFYCYFFFPVLIGVYCSYICRLEHMNNNWNSVLATPVKISSIYFSKFVTVIKMIFLTQVFIGILFYISGKISGFKTPIPKEVVLWLFFGLVAGAVLASVQLTISLIIESFAVPIGISLIGGVIGLAARAKGLGIYFPYSLSSIGMCSNNPEASMEYSVLFFIGSCIVYILIFSRIGILKLMKNLD
jgi:hypothetical protein